MKTSTDPKRRASFWVDPYKRDESWKELNNQVGENETFTQKIRAVIARTMFYLWNVLEMENHMTVVGRAIRVFTNVLIIYTSFQIIIFSEQSFLISQSPAIWLFFAVEYFAILFFAVEVALRFITCTSSAKYIRHGPVLGRLLFLVSPKTIVDIIAISPSIGAAIYDANSFFHNDDISSVVNPVTSRGVDVLRLIRLIKLTRNARFFRVLGKIIIRKKSEIANIVVCMIIIIVLFSSMMCWLEGGIQPNYFGSIPRSFYFCLVTLMTIGFGDVSAETSKFTSVANMIVWGKTITVLFSLSGIIVFSVMTGAFSSAYIEQMKLDTDEYKATLAKRRKKNVDVHLKRRRLYSQNTPALTMMFPHVEQLKTHFSKSVEKEMEDLGSSNISDSEIEKVEPYEGVTIDMTETATPTS